MEDDIMGTDIHTPSLFIEHSPLITLEELGFKNLAVINSRLTLVRNVNYCCFLYPVLVRNTYGF